MKFGYIVFEKYEWTNRPKDMNTAILCTPPGVDVINTRPSQKAGIIITGSIIKQQSLSIADWNRGCN